MYATFVLLYQLCLLSFGKVKINHGKLGVQQLIFGHFFALFNTSFQLQINRKQNYEKRVKAIHLKKKKRNWRLKNSKGCISTVGIFKSDFE